MIPPDQSQYFRLPDMPKDDLPNLPSNIEVRGLLGLAGNSPAKPIPGLEIQVNLDLRKLESGEDCHCVQITAANNRGLNVYLTKNSITFEKGTNGR